MTQRERENEVSARAIDARNSHTSISLVQGVCSCECVNFNCQRQKRFFVAAQT